MTENLLDLEFSLEEGCVAIRREGEGEVSQLVFGSHKVKIFDSYIFSTEEIRSIVLYIIGYTEVFGYTEDCGLKISRSYKELCGEIILRKWLYKLHIKRAQTKDCDLDFHKDSRWYVNLLSKIIGFFL